MLLCNRVLVGENAHAVKDLPVRITTEDEKDMEHLLGERPGPFTLRAPS